MKSHLTSRNWAVFFRQLDVARIVSGDHEVRASVGAVLDGTIFYEADRNAFYCLVNGTWRYMGGMMIGWVVDRPTDLGDNDLGFSYITDDWSAHYIWDGSAWQEHP